MPRLHSSYYSYYFFLLVCSHLLQDCWFDCHQTFTHEAYSYGLCVGNFYVVIQNLDRSLDPLLWFQDFPHISKTTWRIFNFFFLNESSHWVLKLFFFDGSDPSKSSASKSRLSGFFQKIAIISKTNGRIFNPFAFPESSHQMLQLFFFDNSDPSKSSGSKSRFYENPYIKWYNRISESTQLICNFLMLNERSYWGDKLSYKR